jgi:hypothetical protein
VSEELKHFGRSFSGEEMADCKGCGENWYVKWHKDGFCQSCQEKGLGKGKSIDITTVKGKCISLAVFPVAIFEMCLNIVTLGFYSRWMNGRTLIVRMLNYAVKNEK